MKRMMIILFTIGMTAMSSTCMAAMSTSKVRKETRFLSDKMAYELNLSTAQYNDVYEINYDFIDNARYIMDDVVRGYAWAMDEYYELLDIRNENLCWVLSDIQYRRFMGIDYFYRPIYASNNNWQFRVYISYTNRNHFYFPSPYHYKTYCGGHYHVHYNGNYYQNRYQHTKYNRPVSVRHETVYRTNRTSDFGSVRVRPNTTTRTSTSTTRKDDVYSVSRTGSGSSRSTNSTNSVRSSSSSGRNSSGTSSGSSVRQSSSGSGSSGSVRSSSGSGSSRSSSGGSDSSGSGSSRSSSGSSSSRSSSGRR